MEAGWNMGVEAGDKQGVFAVSQQAESTNQIARPALAKDGFHSERAEATPQDTPKAIAVEGQSEFSRNNSQRDCEGAQTIHGQAGPANCESELATPKDDQHIEKLEKKGIRKVDRINTDNLMRLFYQQGGKCALSGRELTPDNIQLDHIDPFAGSDDHSIANVHLVTAEINSAKGCMSVDEFVAMCCEVADRARMGR